MINSSLHWFCSHKSHLTSPNHQLMRHDSAISLINWKSNQCYIFNPALKANILAIVLRLLYYLRKQYHSQKCWFKWQTLGLNQIFNSDLFWEEQKLSWELPKMMYNVLKLLQPLRWFLWQWDLIIYMLNNSAEKPPLPALTLQHKETLSNTYSHSCVRANLHNKGRGNGNARNGEIRNKRPS